MRKETLVKIIYILASAILLWFVADIGINREYHVRRIMNAEMDFFISGNCGEVSRSISKECLRNSFRNSVSTYSVNEVTFDGNTAFIQVIFKSNDQEQTQIFKMKKDGIFADDWTLIRHANDRSSCFED